MQHLVFDISDLAQLTNWLSGLPDSVRNKHILAGIYSSEPDPEWFVTLHDTIRAHLPSATITGCNCPATIHSSVDTNQHSQLSLMVFESSSVQGYSLPMTHASRHDGELLADTIINASPVHPAGVMLLFSPTLLDVSEFYSGLYEGLGGVPVFGGGAGDMDDIHNVIMMLNGEIFESGFIAIAFYGKQLRLETTYHLGWIPFGETMTITSAHNNTVDSINHRSAAELYNHFIGFEEEDFFSHALEFPFIIKRNGVDIARVPFSVTEQQQMTFVADIRRGDQVQFAYGDINSILENLDFSEENLNRFQPEAVFLFSCVSRLGFLNDHPDVEMAPYLNIANAGGFFSYGEIDSMNCHGNILNATIVAVAFSEKPVDHERQSVSIHYQDNKVSNSRDLTRLKRLMFFISRVTEDLQKANQELRNISQKDALTGIYNRRALTTKLKQELQYAFEGALPISLIMMDIDHFKSVNDNHGHLTGDKVITATALPIASCTRPGDFLARYGGEEFMLILPATNRSDAVEIAERIRLTIEQQTRNMDIPEVTCSAGVAWSLNGNTPPDTLINQADQALYRAKLNGRNSVFLSRDY